MVRIQAVTALALLAGFAFAQTEPFPGTTHAKPELRDESLSEIRQAVFDKTGCKETALTNTKFEGDDPITGPMQQMATLLKVKILRHWHETWTVAACGQSLGVHVEYVESTVATTIVVSGEDVTPAPRN